MAEEAPVVQQNNILEPEVILKKRKVNERTRLERVEAALEKKQSQNKKKNIVFKRAESFVKNYRDGERERLRLKRVAKKTGSALIDEEPKLLFCIRLAGARNIPPKARKVLQLLRLASTNNGVFVRNTKSTANMLKLVEPYVTYGVPSLKSVRELIYKRGFGKIKGQRAALSDNALIEEALGKFDVISIEDIIHELYNVGPHFKEVSSFLWPFKLSSIKHSLIEKKVKHYNEGGKAGFCGEDINDLIKEQA
ncbi:ribosomal protein L7-like Rlp7 involved in ribosome biogenesis [Schizosaccharomyces osmophilus]|uniref:Ribosomal protein L7-like Rlp7 involved in ribosome biogenesis n=1 Tax=Schizosaccharomyces osmophilus TaxID=2545709 RepID=A0AAE9WBN1_9SCHI|nr:ribosomal protein L7-like Rlp7 involved in ribosome biogenesis [Schizosaccharomyces osmophilus]WBW72267.1 ribosomal protein L7-like Rlp7 involved in ribosome biogenesis [Schizosaccharomyces osmophilus]